MQFCSSERKLENLTYKQENNVILFVDEILYMLLNSKYEIIHVPEQEMCIVFMTDRSI